jgi:rhodanese-related sulfurtransferase
MGLFSPVTSIDARQAGDLLASGEAALLDVRQDSEWEQEHIAGAVHIPLEQVSHRAHELPARKTVITICRSGHRSARAARTLRRAGYQVENLRGGIRSWAKAGLPLERHGGRAH